MADKKFVIRCRAVILHDGKLLVVRHAHDKSFVALPGGHLEWGEDVQECLKREIVEELGIEPMIGRLLYVNTFQEGENVQPVEFFFEVTNAADYLEFQHKERSHAYELAETLWISSSDDIKLLPKVFADDFKAGKTLSDKVRYIATLS